MCVKKCFEKNICPEKGPICVPHVYDINNNKKTIDLCVSYLVPAIPASVCVCVFFCHINTNIFKNCMILIMSVKKKRREKETKIIRIINRFIFVQTYRRTKENKNVC